MLAKRVGFYIVLPLLIGLVLGGNQAGLAGFMPWTWSMLYWLGMSLGVWMIFHLATLATAHLLRPWTSALWLILLLGALIGSFPARAAIYGYSPLFESFLIGGRTVRAMPPASFSAEFLLRHLQLWSPLFVLWAAANWAADRWLGFPRYRLGGVRESRAAAVAVAPASALTANGQTANAPTDEAPRLPAEIPNAAPAGVLLGRLPPALGRNLIALKAEDHYVRVYTDKGDTLVLCRINDAIAEATAAGFEGLRVHRSWWVATKAVRLAEVQGRGLQLTLANDLHVPVSQTYKEFVRRSGLLDEAAGRLSSAAAD
jgi:hypothetical protein